MPVMDSQAATGAPITNLPHMPGLIRASMAWDVIPATTAGCTIQPSPGSELLLTLLRRPYGSCQRNQRCVRGGDLNASDAHILFAQKSTGLSTSDAIDAAAALSLDLQVSLGAHRPSRQKLLDVSQRLTRAGLGVPDPPQQTYGQNAVPAQNVPRVEPMRGHAASNYGLQPPAGLQTTGGTR